MTERLVYKAQGGTHRRSNRAWLGEFGEERTFQEDRICGAKAQGAGMESYTVIKKNKIIAARSICSNVDGPRESI